MGKTTVMLLLVAGVWALPAQAGEVGILLGKAFGKSQSLGDIELDAMNPTVFGIRGGVSLVNLKVAEVGICGTYQVEAVSDYTATYARRTDTIGQYRQSSFAIGVQVDWKLALNINAALEIRQDSLQSELDSGYTTGTTKLTRPWVRAGLGYIIPTPKVKFFFRAELALALEDSGGSTDLDANDDEFNQAFAPNSQFHVYSGIRF